MRMRRIRVRTRAGSPLSATLRCGRSGAAIVAALVLCGNAALSQAPANNPLAFLQPLIGEWVPNVPDSILRQRPELKNLVAHHYAWTVGRNAIRLRENYARGKPDSSELDGLIYWDPTKQLVEFVAVAGHADGQGRLFHGEYTRLSDGRIERVYDVQYRTKADMPGEELGGTRRRYREVYTVESRTVLSFTLEWWRDGRWQPFGYGVGKYVLTRLTGAE